MEKLKLELAENFANRSIGIRLIRNFDYELYSYTDQNTYGIMIKSFDGIRINERMGKISIYSQDLEIGNKNYNCIFIVCNEIERRNRFIDFIVDNLYTNYEIISHNPIYWWKDWCLFLGNKFIDKRTYDIFGELYVLNTIYEKDRNAVWNSMFGGSVDIENCNNVYEVKSTIKKYESTVTVSSQQQLLDGLERQLYLVFVRLEFSDSGKCIEDYVNKLERNGYRRADIEDYLKKCSCPINSHSRFEMYNILETRLYTIDKKFPKITKSSFKNDMIPLGITKISYEIDLNNIEYKDFENEWN